MPVRSAHATWSGPLEEGSGKVELTSSATAAFDVSFPRRADDEAQGVTCPEELIAAAHASCYAMQFSFLLTDAGADDVTLDVTADVRLGPDPTGGFRIPGIKLTVRGDASGITAEQFAELAEQAKKTCPVSKALTGTTIVLDADLA